MDKTKITVGIFNKLAQLYQEKYMDVSAYHDSFNLFCDAIKQEQASVLEIACGPGNITHYLLKKRPDLKILGTDLSENMVALAKINNPGAEFQVMDARDLGKLNKQFDAIMCGFCLPYLSKEDAMNLIGNASRSLKPNGVLYISTMEDEYSKSGLKAGSTGDEIYMHFHEAGYLTYTLLKNGFNILDLQRKEYPGPDGTTTKDLLIVAKIDY